MASHSTSLEMGLSQSATLGQELSVGFKLRTETPLSSMGMPLPALTSECITPSLLVSSSTSQVPQSASSHGAPGQQRHLQLDACRIWAPEDRQQMNFVVSQLAPCRLLPGNHISARYLHSTVTSGGQRGGSSQLHKVLGCRFKCYQKHFCSEFGPRAPYAREHLLKHGVCFPTGNFSVV